MMGSLLRTQYLKVLDSYNISSAVAGFLGYLSLLIVLQQGNAEAEDRKTISHFASSVLVGTSVVAVVELAVTVILSIAYRTQERHDRQDGANHAQVGYETANRPILLLWFPMSLASLVVIQFFVGLILWHSARSPSWSTILVMMESLILLVGSAMILGKALRDIQNEQTGEDEQDGQGQKGEEGGQPTQPYPTFNLYTIPEQEEKDATVSP
jgi:integral membrane sensor domain MASE1